MPRRRDLVVGALAAEIEFDDADFDAVDPDIMRMFYGDDWVADDPPRLARSTSPPPTPDRCRQPQRRNAADLVGIEHLIDLAAV